MENLRHELGDTDKQKQPQEEKEEEEQSLDYKIF